MVLTMARLFFYVSIALLLLLLLPEQGIAMVLSWMVLYLLFVTLEASEMARLVRQKTPQPIKASFYYENTPPSS